MRLRRWLPAATITAAAVLGTPLPAMSAGEPGPVNDGAPYAVEEGAYPYAKALQANTGAEVIAGDGNIAQTPCSGTYQIMVWARDVRPGNTICFRAANTGFLSVKIPRAYRIETHDRDIAASITVAGGTPKPLAVPRDTEKGFGEVDPTAPGEAVLLDLRVTGSSTAVPGQPAGENPLPSLGKIRIGDIRSCTATLVDPQWVITAKSCFASKPAESIEVAAGAPKEKTTVTVGRADLAASGGHTSDIAQLVPHSDRDLVMARLDQPATGVTPVSLSSTAPQSGEELTVSGFGRTDTEWAPTKPHTAAFTAGESGGRDVELTVKSPAGATFCQGDAGSPALRTENGKPALVAVGSRAGQAGCFGTDEGIVTGGARASRTDDLRNWIQQTRALASGWKTEAVVQGGTQLFQGIRLADGSWTDFTDVEGKAGSIGGVRASSVAGINADTHVVALGGNGKIHHTIRRADGTWLAFGDVNAAAGQLANTSQVSAVSIGYELHVVAVAGGKPYHSVRRQNGTWAPFGDATGAAGPIGAVTAVATASAAGQLQVAAVTGGKAFHTLRATNGTWTKWGDVAAAAGPTGPISSIAMAGIGNDTHIVIATDNGTRQYHGVRLGNGTWTGFGDLAYYLGRPTAKSVAAANVNGELLLAATTHDGKLIHTLRRANGTWATTTPVGLDGLTGTPGGIAVTGTH
ncbi:S1 family peptidase [Streptomyces sp. NPDC056773]|uniref:S1 family peptidase n=1 Tax=unclassified Streptomyces TaxID=2593676 RepID=UPI003689AD7B